MAGKFFQKPGPELADRVPPGQHLAMGFPVLTYGDTPHVTQADWSLTIIGLAEPKTLTLGRHDGAAPGRLYRRLPLRHHLVES
jgi:DMSO/TMAO reductase YedYZ molybdopterin-dependent catalytic subunit